MFFTFLHKKLEREIDRLTSKFFLPRHSNFPTTCRLSKMLLTSKTSPFHIDSPSYSDSPYTTIPTNEANIERLRAKLTLYQRRFAKFGAIKIVDVISEKYNKRPMYVFTENHLIQEIYQSTAEETIKRFQVQKLTERQYLEDKGQTLQGYFLETYIIAELNQSKNWRCPQCGMQNNMSLCIENGYVSESFRDAICLGCKCFFEIKTKNDSFFRNKVYKKKLVHAGDYISINTLLHLRKPVYIILFNRDNGDVFCGKIIECFIRENEKFLYSLQEGGHLDFGYPSSYVRVDDFENVVTIKKADDYISLEKSDEISRIVIEDLLLKH